MDDEIDCYVDLSTPQCPEGQCKDFWSHTYEDGHTVLKCGWCGRVSGKRVFVQ